jgi:L-aminopeptidase/D-esterase-like protein
MNMRGASITDVTGILVGHQTNIEEATGCTVVLCEDGAVGGVDVRGSAPGTRETDLMRPTALVNEVHGILLSGGSAFGLAAATGVVRYLEGIGVGLKFGGATIPIVPAAILFDLGLVQGDIRPSAYDGEAACRSASISPPAQGSVGAGTGATVGKMLGMHRAMKGGIGTASISLGDGLVVGAIVAVNAIGGVYEASAGRIVAGPRAEDGNAILDAMEVAISPPVQKRQPVSASNTTIGVVATNAALNKEQANKLASAAQDGIALAVRPAHLMGDGDTMFALGTGKNDSSVDMNQMLAAAAMCVSDAIVNAVKEADPLGGVPAFKDLVEDE